MRQPWMFLPLAFAALAACNSGGAPAGSADASNAPCVLTNGTWDCPAVGRSYPACPAGANEAPTCSYDGGLCYGCVYDNLAGATCTCGGEAGAVWSCLPSGTACSQ